MDASTRPHSAPDDGYDAALIERLRKHPLNGGPSAGGPVWGIDEDDVTTPIIAEGNKIVPRLVDELVHSNWAESTYIVFMLRKIKAKSARHAVLELQTQLLSATRFQNEERNFTLNVLIDSYLRESINW